jgi:toxin ParE1/3/4
MKSRYTRLALTDLGEADAFIRREDPAAAHQVMQRIEAAISRLASFPESGWPRRVAGTRELVVPRYFFRRRLSADGEYRGHPLRRARCPTLAVELPLSNTRERGEGSLAGGDQYPCHE